ncbi:MAG TPA: aldehyde ferredoxin oxidoreductase C-terminal domain-containing protein [Polyangia bacterium]
MYQQKALAIDLGTGYYRVERLRDARILGPVDYGYREWLQSGATCFGGGAFMGSVLPGSNRLVVTGHSPCWDGFYVSTVGGAAFTFENVGLNYVGLNGRCPVPSVLVLRREGQEEAEVELAPVDVRAVFGPLPRTAEEAESGGFYALQRHLWDRYASTFSTQPRILAVGPAALASDFGAIGSSKVESTGLTKVDCWAGRGGLGSRLAQHHNLVGIVFGGSFIDVDLDDRKVADAFFQKRYHVRMVLKDKEATTKYRYDPALQTGGTLGVNLTKLKDKLFFFNYRSVDWPTAQRLALHQDVILPHYLKQFNDETIETKEFSHCGEPCMAACKKMRGPYKKDYEPYETMGPNLGIFDQRAAEQVVGYADAMGFDSIQVGGVLSWLFELLDDGLVDGNELGLAQTPVFKPEGFRVVEDSRHNAALACELLRAIVEHRADLDFRQGAREVARRLGQRTGMTRQILDRLVVNCASERGWMVPNQYWVPGMFSPMPVMGKYYEYYGDDFSPPRALGRAHAERMVQELVLDNFGCCRFHRDWAEELVPEMFREFWGVDVDLRAHHLALARRINARNAAAFWESSRVVALVHTYLKRKAEEGTKRPELDEWLARFEQDPWQAGRDYWYEIRQGLDEALAEKY